MFQRLLEHKITFAVAVAGVVAVIGIGGWYVLKPPVRHYTAAAVSIRDIQESVEASGVIDADQHVSLAFRAAGTVAAVDVSVGQLVHAGQVLATLDNSTLAAGLEGADADVLSAEANLSSVERGATSETRAVSSQGVATAAAALGIAENDTYIKVLDAILNKSDTLFANGTSPNPILVIPVPDATAVIAVNSQRVDIGQRLNNWKNMLAASSSPTDQGLIQEASSDISATQSFLNTISAWTNRLNVNNTGLTQDQIMAYVSAMNGALVEVNAAAGEFTSALQAWRTAGDQQAVVTASSTDESVQIAQAAVAKARAAVASFQSQIANGQLVAPFDG
ncbi:MAG: biotin/lipoyl-binding protein, partial [Patescibacteria group bacterium]|nr:biotin/lipoyl-binding protein [Patescibacteria group bacterium]